MLFQDLRPEQELILEKRVDGETEHELHLHDLLEINVLLENEARFKLASRTYEGKAGDVFLFRPYEPHYNLAAAEGKPITWLMVLFSASIARLIPYGYQLLVPFYTEGASPHIPASSPYAQRIQAAARAAYAEQAEKRPGWEAKRFLHFIDVLAEVYRYAVDSASGAGGAGQAGEAGMGEAGVQVDAGIVAAVEHILRHITEDIDVRELIELYGKGKTTFYTTFRQAVGVSPNRFIHRLRMQIAMHLLKTTDKTVTEIAFECGYHSIHYFNRHFKQFRQLSPREYRNRAKRAI